MIYIEQQILNYLAININQTHPDWSASTPYVSGDVIFFDHYYYKSVIDGNTNKNPTDNPDLWVRWAISNRYAQIDLRATTKTVWDATTALVPSDDALITKFTNTGFNALSFGHVHGDNVKVQLFDNNNILQFEETKVVYPRPTSNNWYNYYFEAFKSSSYTGVEEDFFFRLPPKTGYIIVTVAQDLTSRTASVGFMVAGEETFVGTSLFGASMGVTDNSLVEIDDFGITTVKKRIANTFMDIDVYFPSNQIKQMERKAARAQGKILVFVGDEQDASRYEFLATLGYVESYTAVLSLYENTTASYSIKEVI